jgi:hypothetical protein
LPPKYLGRRSAAPNKFITTLTQGSQSLALGLVPTAASQLVESRRSEPARSKGRRNRIAESTARRDVGATGPRDVHLSAYAGPLSHWERAGVRERSLAKPTSSMKRSASTALSMRRSSSRRHMRSRWRSIFRREAEWSVLLHAQRLLRHHLIETGARYRIGQLPGSQKNRAGHLFDFLVVNFLQRV